MTFTNTNIIISIARRCICLTLVITFMASDIAFAFEKPISATLAPESITQSPARKNHWIFADISMCIGEMLVLTRQHKFKHPADLLIPKIEQHVAAKAGSRYVFLEDLDYKSITDYRRNGEHIGFILPIRRFGRARHKLLYTLIDDPARHLATIPLPDGSSVYILEPALARLSFGNTHYSVPDEILQRIRPGTRADLQAIIALSERIFHATDTTRRDRLRRLLDETTEDGPVWVYCDNRGAVRGYVRLAIDWKRRVGSIAEISVDPAHSGDMVGYTLMTHALSRAWSEGIREFDILALHRDSIRLVKKLGFALAKHENAKRERHTAGKPQKGLYHASFPDRSLIAPVTPADQAGKDRQPPALEEPQPTPLTDETEHTTPAIPAENIPKKGMSIEPIEPPFIVAIARRFTNWWMRLHGIETPQAVTDAPSRLPAEAEADRLAAMIAAARTTEDVIALARAARTEIFFGTMTTDHFVAALIEAIDPTNVKGTVNLVNAAHHLGGQVWRRFMKATAYHRPPSNTTHDSRLDPGAEKYTAKPPLATKRTQQFADRLARRLTFGAATHMPQWMAALFVAPWYESISIFFLNSFIAAHYPMDEDEEISLLEGWGLVVVGGVLALNAVAYSVGLHVGQLDIGIMDKTVIAAAILGPVFHASTIASHHLVNLYRIIHNAIPGTIHAPLLSGRGPSDTAEHAQAIDANHGAVRPATLDDVAAIRQLSRLLPDTGRLFEKDFSKLISGVPAQDEGKNLVLVYADRDGSVVGYACGRSYAEDSSSHIDDLVVDEQAQGRGVGSALFREIAKESSRLGARRIAVTAISDGTAKIAIAHGLTRTVSFNDTALQGHYAGAIPLALADKATIRDWLVDFIGDNEFEIGRLGDGTVHMRTPDVTLDPIFAAISEVTGDLAGKRLLDLGAGDLRVALWAAHLYGMHVTACEKDRAVCAEAAKVYGIASREGLLDPRRLNYRHRTDAFNVDWSAIDLVYLFHPYPAGARDSAAFNVRLAEKARELPDGAHIAVLYVSDQLDPRFGAADRVSGLTSVWSEPRRVSLAKGGLYLQLYRPLKEEIAKSGSASMETGPKHGQPAGAMMQHDPAQDDADLTPDTTSFPRHKLGEEPKVITQTEQRIRGEVMRALQAAKDAGNLLPDTCAGRKPPKGTPGTLLRYLYEHGVFANPKQGELGPQLQKDMAHKRGGNDSPSTISLEAHYLREIDLLEGESGQPVHLPAWFRRVDSATFENLLLTAYALDEENAAPNEIELIAARDQLKKLKTRLAPEEAEDPALLEVRIAPSYLSTLHTAETVPTFEEMLFKMQVEAECSLRILLNHPPLNDMGLFQQVNRLISRVSKELKNQDGTALTHDVNKAIQDEHNALLADVISIKKYLDDNRHRIGTLYDYKYETRRYIEKARKKFFTHHFDLMEQYTARIERTFGKERARAVFLIINDRFERIDGLLSFASRFLRGVTDTHRDNLNAVIRDTAEQTHMEWPGAKKVTIDTPADERLADVPFDRHYVQFVVAELVRNALKEASVSEVQLGYRYDRRTGCVTLTVSDNGAGIDPALLAAPREGERQELFKYNVTSAGKASGRAEGTGLGLTFVYELMDRMKGSIAAANKAAPDHGAVFTVTFPLKGDEFAAIGEHGIAAFAPAEAVAAWPQTQAGELSLTISALPSARPDAQPAPLNSQQIKARVHYHDKRYGTDRSGNPVWITVDMKRMANNEGRTHRFAIRTPADFEGEYAFMYSIDGGMTWLATTEPGNNRRIVRQPSPATPQAPATDAPVTEVTTGTGAITIVPAAESDIEPILQLWKTVFLPSIYGQDNHRRIDYTVANKQQALTDLIHGVSREFTDSRAFVAKNGDTVIGCSIGYVDHNGEGWIDSVIVDPAWENRGIGTGLFRSAVDWLRDNPDAHELWVQDDSRLHRTGKMARRSGFTRTENPGVYTLKKPTPSRDRRELDLTIPLEDQLARWREQFKDGPAKTVRPLINVLINDDDENVRDGLARAVKQFLPDAKTVVVTTSDQAIEAAANGTFHLIVTDRMTNSPKSGTDLIAAVRRAEMHQRKGLEGQCIILMISGDLHEAAQEPSFDAGLFGPNTFYAKKPLSFVDALESLLETVWDMHPSGAAALISHRNHATAASAPIDTDAQLFNLLVTLIEKAPEPKRSDMARRLAAKIRDGEIVLGPTEKARLAQILLILSDDARQELSAAAGDDDGVRPQSPDLLKQQFEKYEGIVYYPCALSDVRSALDLAVLFPKATIILNDAFAEGGAALADEMPDTRNLYEVAQFLDEQIRRYRKAKKDVADVKVRIIDEERGRLDVSLTLTEHGSRLLHRNTIAFQYRVGKFEDDQEKAGVIFVKRPGFGGELSNYPEFWDDIHQKIISPGYVLVSSVQTASPVQAYSGHETWYKIVDNDTNDRIPIVIAGYEVQVLQAILDTSNKEMPEGDNNVEPANQSTTRETELLQAEYFKDLVAYIESEQEKAENPQDLIVMLGTSWIKGYVKGRECDAGDMQQLIQMTRKYCEQHDISFIDTEDENIPAALAKARKGKVNAKVLVLAGKESVLSPEFGALRDDANVFMAGIDGANIDETSYIRLIEMLTISMKLALGIVVSTDNPHINIVRNATYKNVFIFLPRAEAIKISDTDRDAFYKTQISA